MLLGLDVREDAAANAWAGDAGMSSQAPPGHPARGRFFDVAAGLLARRSSSFPVFPMRNGISDAKIGERLTAYSCGGSAGFSHAFARSPASLLATKSCDLADRDGYMW